MRQFLGIILLIGTACYKPQRLPSPLPAALAQRLDVAFDWIATALDTTEARSGHRIRLLATQGPTPGDHWKKPFIHDSAWLEAHAHKLGVSGLCSPPFRDCFPEGGFLLVVGLPDSLDRDAGYVWTQFSLYAPGEDCPAPPGAGGRPVKTAPWWVYSYFWNLYMVRHDTGGWAVDSSNAKGTADNFGGPCPRAA